MIIGYKNGWYCSRMQRAYVRIIYLYDYTNLNIKLIDKYNLDLKIFYNELPQLHNIIEEIPMDKINVIV